MTNRICSNKSNETVKCSGARRWRERWMWAPKCVDSFFFGSSIQRVPNAHRVQLALRAPATGANPIGQVNVNFYAIFTVDVLRTLLYLVHVKLL